jgi:hypothetical protein
MAQHFKQHMHVLINLNVLNACYNEISNIIYATSCVAICCTITKTFLTLRMEVFASILFSL